MTLTVIWNASKGDCLTGADCRRNVHRIIEEVMSIGAVY